MRERNIAGPGLDTGRGLRERARFVAGTTFLILQVVLFVRARFTEARYFCWAPFHSEARYTIDATIDGRALGDDEIARRYGLPRYYWDEATRTNWELNAIAHVTDTIRETEATLPASDRAAVVVTYRVNGRPREQWHSR